MIYGSSMIHEEIEIDRDEILKTADYVLRSKLIFWKYLLWCLDKYGSEQMAETLGTTRQIVTNTISQYRFAVGYERSCEYVQKMVAWEERQALAEEDGNGEN